MCAGGPCTAGRHHLMHQRWHDWPSADRIIGRRPVDTAHQAGTPADELANPTAGIALGDSEVRPLDMAAAFATFAADGVRHPPHVVNEVPSADGRVLFEHVLSSGDQAIHQQVARNVTESMKGVPSRVGLALDEGRTAAAKRRALRTHESRGRTSTLAPLAPPRRCRQRYGSAPISATPPGPTQGRCWTARFLARYGDRS